MAEAAVRDITFEAGDYYRLTITITDGTDPIDKSGSDFDAVARTGRDVPVPFTVDTTNAADGVIVISLTVDQTAQFASRALGRGTWKFRELVGGLPTTLLKGSIDAEP
jgi:hypothetical protein